MARRQEQIFGDYTLVERIARGGMAEIFLARSRGFRGFEKTLVIKRLHAHYSDDAEFIHMLVDEAKITVQLQHSNIVQIFDLGHVDGQYYIAMEFIDGLDLFRVLRELHDRDLLMPMAAAAHITAELCHGLYYAHTRRDVTTGEPLGVIHRDISPQNLLLSWAGEVKLADFGIVKATHRSTHTQAGIIKGKFYYMSPEQALGQPLDHRSDIFSAGIVLYEALTARPLYDDGDDAELLKRVQMARITSPREIRPDIPADLEAICMRALAPEREDRYATALELARDLNDFVVRQGRSFTKIDLAEFLQSLFDDPVADDASDANAPPPIPDDAVSDPANDEVLEGVAAPAGPYGALDLSEVDPGATVALPLSALTGNAQRDADVDTTETPGPALTVPRRALDQPTLGAKPGRMVPSRTASAQGLSTSSAETSEPPRPTPPRRAPSAPAIVRTDNTAVVARPTTGGRGEPSRPPPQSEVAEALTTRLSLDEIRQQDAEIRQRLDAANQPAPPGWVLRRDRSLKVALFVVLLAIMVVSAAILWLLANPIVPTAAAPSEAVSTEANEPVRSKAKPPSRTPVAPPLTSTSAGERTGRLVLSTAPNVRSYRLYVDGELADATGGELRLPVGRHTITARLQPQGRMTERRVVRVEPGGTIRLLLE